jgi:hypothetical protein
MAHDFLTELLSDDDVNGPEPIAAGLGMIGPRVTVTPKEAKERRVALADLMSHGVSQDEIVDAMRAKFEMTEDQTLALSEKVNAQVITEFTENSTIHKAMASRRLHRHIVGATKARQWSAVAQLEGQLAKIQGTESPSEQRLTIDARLQQATLQVLGGMTPAQVNELVGEEVRRMTAGKVSLETTAEEV